MNSDQRRAITKYIVWGSVVLWGVWELLMVYLQDYKALITPYVKQVRGFPLLVMAIGVLTSHFLVDPTRPGLWVKDLITRYPILALVIGMGIGLLWPSKR